VLREKTLAATSDNVWKSYRQVLALPLDRTAHGRNLLFRTMTCLGDLFHCFK
jgi:hypothetical protein